MSLLFMLSFEMWLGDGRLSIGGLCKNYVPIWSLVRNTVTINFT